MQDGEALIVGVSEFQYECKLYVLSQLLCELIIVFISSGQVARYLHLQRTNMQKYYK